MRRIIATLVLCVVSAALVFALGFPCPGRECGQIPEPPPIPGIP